METNTTTVALALAGSIVVARLSGAVSASAGAGSPMLICWAPSRVTVEHANMTKDASMNVERRIPDRERGGGPRMDR